MTTTPMLIISGAGLPSWIWDDTTTGLTATVADRPGHSAARLREHAQVALDQAPAAEFMVVAHSSGGMVAAEIARLAPERVIGLLGIAAIIPRPGGSFLSSMPAPNRYILSAIMRLTGTRPPTSAIRAGLAAGLDEKIIERLLAGFAPESQAYYRDRVPTAGFPAIRGYIRTTSDRELPPSLQDRFASTLDTTDIKTIDSGHLPMLEQPTQFREALLSFAQRVATAR